MNISTTGYSDFKALADSRHFKDVFYVTDSSTLLIAYVIGENSSIASNNIIADITTFNSDFPNATSISNGLSFS